MSYEVPNPSPEMIASDAAMTALEKRLCRNMGVALAAAMLGSILVAPWRVTTGLALGGILAFLNYYWLRTSLTAMFGPTETTGVPPVWNGPRYILRYFIVGSIICGVSAFNLISLPAAIAGLCAFAVALTLEGFGQLFAALLQREES